MQIESIPKKFLRKITTSDTTTTTKTTPLDHSIYQPQSVATPVALPQQHPSQAASFTLHLPSLHSLDDPWRPTVIPLAWQQAAREILADYCQTHHRPDHDCFVVAICGGKGVGKSTCLRYLLHQFLNLAHIHQNNDNDMPHLSILDADLGQPELGPPGLVTFTSTLTQPLWTPPHLHMVLPNQLQQQQPNDNTCFVPQQQAYFLGSIAGSQSDTTGYMQSMAALRHSSHASDSPPPSSLRQRRPRVLLVNLDGWVKGLGGELLQALLQQTLQPLHHVIQIQGPTASQQFALSPFPQSDDASAITTRIHEVSSYHCIQDDDKDHPNETGGDSAMRPPPPSLVNGPSPASLRTMRLGTYFLSDEMTNLWDQSNLVYGGIQGLNMARRLAALRPYAVPLHSVRLMDPTKNPYYDTRWSDNSHVDLSTWNATLVGLASSPDDNATRESEDAAPRPPTPWYLVPCHGLGLIRSIDVVKQTLYILTPIPHPQRVTILIKSCHLSLPLELINRGVESECFPYLEFTSPQESTNNNSMDPGEDDAPMTTTPILGTSPIKSRNTLARRNQQPQQHRHHRHRHRTHGHGPSGK
uniref:Uncharacterized protein n=1 Tax=Entomoneis paludosa TaxID=265537 RepID=A0A7S3DS93_9STRA